MRNKLFIFGFGYTAAALAKPLHAAGWAIAGTTRQTEKREQLGALGYSISNFNESEVRALLQDATHIVSAAPLLKNFHDPVLSSFTPLLREAASHLKWLGYLSTTGVYGDHQGAWVDETSPLKPDNDRTRGRVAAEQSWLSLGHETGIPTHIFRLAGIYGPGRNALRQLKDGTAKSIYKEGQVFSRIHVEDIANIITASISAPHAGGIYNACDDEPAPAHEVTRYAAQLLDIEPPALIPFEEAQLSDMAKEFYSNNRRVANAKLKQELRITLTYPTYREGLSVLFNSGTY